MRDKERMPRKMRNLMGSRSPEEDWKTLSEEKEERTREEREISERGTDRDSVG